MTGWVVGSKPATFGVTSLWNGSLSYLYNVLKMFILSDLLNSCNGMNCFKYSFYVNLLSLKHNGTVLNLILSFLGAVVKLPTKCERDNPLMQKWSCRLSTCSNAWSCLVAVYFMLDIVILSVLIRTLAFVYNCIFELESSSNSCSVTKWTVEKK